MINPIEKVKCCGCSACVSICPQKCISMTTDIEGFLYPVVNKSLCVNCNLCNKVCPFNSAEKSEVIPIKTFAAKSYDDNIREKSSSGGLFTLLAEIIIEHNGVVFGAKFDEEWNVVHSFVETKEDLRLFRGSKYVQSAIGDSYHQAKLFLDKGRMVMFSGTSCQIMGLNLYLGKQYSNLITIDVICHGVPSPQVWTSCLSEMLDTVGDLNNKKTNSFFSSIVPRTPQKAHDSLKGINFRDKTYGWKNSCFALYFQEESEKDELELIKALIKNDRNNSYFDAFNKNLILRPSCSNCPAKGGRSLSDITIADFWGVERVLPGFSDNRGVSLCLCNTIKGYNLYKKINVHDCQITFEDAIVYNRSWRFAQRPHNKREKFFKSFAKKRRALATINKCLRPSVVQRLLNKTKVIIKRIIYIS